MNEPPISVFGVKLLGLSTETMKKAVLTVAFTIAFIGLRYLVEGLVRAVIRRRPREGASF